MNHKRKKQSGKKLRYLRSGTNSENKRLFQKIIENDHLDKINEAIAGIFHSGF